MPLELAILNHNKVAARILFPKTSPIQSISNWSLTGVKKLLYSPEQWLKMEQKDEERVVCLKLKGDEAFRRGDYFDAQHWVTKGIHLDGIINSKPNDAKLYSNRSMSFARLKNGRSALTDAQVCVTLRPTWDYRERVAWKLLEEFGEAYTAFCRAAELEPNNLELPNACK